MNQSLCHWAQRAGIRKCESPWLMKDYSLENLVGLYRATGFRFQSNVEGA